MKITECAYMLGVSSITVLALMCPASAFAHCAPVLPDPVWPLKAKILQAQQNESAVPQFGGMHATPEQRACAFYQEGELLQFQGNSERAVQKYTRAIDFMSQFEDAYAARGDAYADLGQPDKAEQDYAAASALHADGAEDLKDRCWLRAVRGRPLDRALADCDAAIQLRPAIAVNFVSRSLVQFRSGHFAEAAADCDTALKLQPDNEDAFYLRGLAKSHLGDAAGGTADLERAKSINSRIADRYGVWGVKE